MRAPSFYSDPHVQFLSQLLDEIGDGGIQVPRFQRPLVWNWERRLELLRSIRDGIPIGAIMVWRTGTVLIDCYQKLGPHVLRQPATGITRQYLLDGVQRLSTLYGALHRPSSEAQDQDLEFADVDFDSSIYEDTDPAEVGSFDVFFDPIKNDFVGPHEIDEATGSLMPISLVFDSIALLRYQRTMPETMDDNAIKATDELARAFRDYKLPVIPITTDDINLATRTFQRINSQGAKMSETHMVHALTWQPNFDLQKRLIELKAEHLSERGWGALDNDPVLKACKAAFGLDVYKASADELSRNLTNNRHVLSEVFVALSRTADFLWHKCGLKTPDLVPYSLQIVVLCEAFRVQPSPTPEVENLLFAWFWMTTYGELFAGMSGDRVQIALADMRATVTEARGVWTWRRPFEERTLRPTFDFRAARAKAFAFRIAAIHDKVKDDDSGARILADSGRRAFAQVIPYSVAKRAAYSSPGNRFIVHPAEVVEFRDRLLTGLLNDQERQAHSISDEAYELLRRGDYTGFVALRVTDIGSREHEFLRPFLTMFGARLESNYDTLPSEFLYKHTLVHLLSHNNETDFQFRLGELQTPIFLTLRNLGDHVQFETSHAIATPLQAGPYWTNRPYGETQMDAVRQAIRALEFYYQDAVENGHTPDEAWLVPRSYDL